MPVTRKTQFGAPVNRRFTETFSFKYVHAIGETTFYFESETQVEATSIVHTCLGEILVLKEGAHCDVATRGTRGCLWL